MKKYHIYKKNKKGKWKKSNKKIVIKKDALEILYNEIS